MANYFGGGERYWEHLEYKVPYQFDVPTYRSDQHNPDGNFYYAPPTYPPYHDYMQNYEPPQDLSYSWHNPPPPPLYNSPPPQGASLEKVDDYIRRLGDQTRAKIIADFQAEFQAQTQRLEAITQSIQSIKDAINFQEEDDSNQQLVVEETTHENLDSTTTTILSGEEAEMRIGETIIDEEKSTIMSEEVNLETWWEDLEEPNYEEGEFDSDWDEYLFGEDMESDKDEETTMCEEKPTLISDLGNDLFELEESEEDSEDVPRLDALESAPSIGHTQILAPFVSRDLSPLSFDELLPSSREVGGPVVTVATNLIAEVYLALMVTKEVKYPVVNLEED